jgi:3-dehydroquinate dehydratase
MNNLPLRTANFVVVYSREVPKVLEKFPGSVSLFTFRSAKELIELPRDYEVEELKRLLGEIGVERLL